MCGIECEICSLSPDLGHLAVTAFRDPFIDTWLWFWLEEITETVLEVVEEVGSCEFGFADEVHFESGGAVVVSSRYDRAGVDSRGS
jgi:hypothetical protein